MNPGRFVVLGLAHVRSEWFTEVARWSTSGTVPVEFVKCVAPEELVARVRSGRVFSAALLDARLAAVDRDLLGQLRTHQIPVVVVDRSPHRASWAHLGADRVVDPSFDAEDLVDLLDHVAVRVSDVSAGPEVDPDEDHRDQAADGPTADGGARAPLITCLGRGGAGASTVAIAVAQGLAARPQARDRPVVLADLALHAHQALLHDAGDVVPGLAELIELHRNGRPEAHQIEALLYRVPTRGYELLLGLRRHHDWVTVRPRALRAGLEGLRALAGAVVVDADHDLEGEADTGSFDVEDRNALSRAAVTQAHLVVVVGRPTATGLHGLALQIGDLHRLGVGDSRILVVVNGAPSRPRARATINRSLAELVDVVAGPLAYAGPVHVPTRRGVDDAHLGVTPLPSAIVAPLHATVQDLLTGVPARCADAATEPTAIVPGELGQRN